MKQHAIIKTVLDHFHHIGVLLSGVRGKEEGGGDASAVEDLKDAGGADAEPVVKTGPASDVGFHIETENK